MYLRQLLGMSAALWTLALVPLVNGAAIRPRLSHNGYPNSFSAIIAFGDSFTDNGNGSWAISNETWPADPHYYDGRFSNGPVWIEYVAANLSIPLFDYAVGGATSSNNLIQGYTGPNSTIPVPSLTDQISNFLHQPPKNIPTSNPLFILFAGANDIFFNPNITASQSFQQILASRALLSSSYPTATFLFLGYPDLSQLPFGYYTTWLNKRELRAYSHDLDTLYRDSVATLRPSPTTQTLFVELSELFEQWGYYAEPRAYGFDPLGAYGSCLVGAYGETEEVEVCSDSSAKVFWDEYHPTTHAHELIAERVLRELGNQGRIA